MCQFSVFGHALFAIASILVAGCGISSGQAPTTPPITEGFESPPAVFVVSGTNATFVPQSNLASHTGAYSFKTNPTACGASCFSNYRINLTYSFPAPVTLISVSVWALERSPTGYAWGGALSIGHDATWDILGAPIVWNNNPITQLWQNYSATVNASATTVQIELGDLTSLTEIFLDDITITYAYCGSPLSGQSNSAAATLIVNGIGATGAGPFNVVIPTSGTNANAVTFTWGGPAAAPLVLCAGTLAPGCMTFGNSGLLDLDLITLRIVFDGTTWPYSLFFNTGPAGSAVHQFALPVGLSPGVLLDVQGAVIQPGFSYPFVATAAFRLQI